MPGIEEGSRPLVGHAQPPLVSYDHDEGESITGGYVYRGKDCPSLAGRYVYADYASGRLWTFSFDGRRASDVRILRDSDLEISSFGEDREGELYATSFDGKVYRFLERRQFKALEIDLAPDVGIR
ncbi:MAG: hypothetical protein HY720_29090 [Planctomycetes bacterium]|nr:hypothetical protein [Planctomycetota bacterium]